MGFFIRPKREIYVTLSEEMPECYFCDITRMSTMDEFKADCLKAAELDLQTKVTLFLLQQDGKFALLEQSQIIHLKDHEMIWIKQEQETLNSSN